MNEGLIPRRYAKALYKVGLERGDAPRLYELMENLAQAGQKLPELSQTIANPYIDTADKKHLLTTAAGATDKDTTFADLLTLLIQNHRIDIAPGIAQAYVNEYRRQNDICRIDITSAAPLPKEMLDRIKGIVSQQLPAGATVETKTGVDPDLIGGFKIDIDNRRLDASVKTQLATLRHQLLN